MKRYTTSRFIVIAVTVLMLVVMSVMASSAVAQDATSDASDDAAASYCTEQGGTVVMRHPALNTSLGKDAIQFAGAREFCEFKDKDSGLASLPVDVLYAEQPTLAAVAYLNAPAFKSTGSTANPSYFYCQQLNGAINFGTGGESGWVNDADPEDVINPCVFADGSMMDAWTLFYKSDGTTRGADLTSHFRWKGAKELMEIFQ
jgi:putative hemolysin